MTVNVKCKAYLFVHLIFPFFFWRESVRRDHFVSLPCWFGFSEESGSLMSIHSYFLLSKVSSIGGQCLPRVSAFSSSSLSRSFQRKFGVGIVRYLVIANFAIKLGKELRPVCQSTLINTGTSFYFSQKSKNERKLLLTFIFSEIPHFKLSNSCHKAFPTLLFRLI